MKKLAAARLRIAQIALAGAQSLPVEARIQLFEDVATILPREQRDRALLSAFSLRESLKHQHDFLDTLLK